MISVRSVSHTYGSGIQALQSVNFTVEPGEFVAVLGANGSGKSTLARHLNGLLLPHSGTVQVGQLSTADPRALPEIRRRVGMVFQNPESQLVAPVVEDEVAFGPENLGLPRSEIRERVDWSLAAVGMSGHIHREPHLLSGGQKQRVAIASVLACRPEFLVLDEATTMLDPAARAEVLDTVLQLRARYGLGLVMITHRSEEVVTADRVVVLAQGSVALDGPATEVLRKSEQLTSLGLEPPPPAQLAQQLRVAGLNPPDLLTEEALLEWLKQTQPSLSPPPEVTPRPVRLPLVELNEASHRYMRGTPFENRSLAQVSLTLNRGDRVGLIGATGSGKSTLAEHLGGLVPLQSGRLHLEGRPVEKSGYRELRRRIALLFQFPEHQMFETSVLAEVGFGPRNYGIHGSELEGRIQTALHQVGLDPQHYGQRSPLELSGGEKRRVALASLLALEPDALILDEPTAGLDPTTRNLLLGNLASWDYTLVVISHHMEELAPLVDRVWAMDQARLVLDGDFALALSEGWLPPPLATRVGRALSQGRWSPQTPEALVAGLAGSV